MVFSVLTPNMVKLFIHNICGLTKELKMLNHQ